VLVLLLPVVLVLVQVLEVLVLLVRALLPQPGMQPGPLA